MKIHLLMMNLHQFSVRQQEQVHTLPIQWLSLIHIFSNGLVALSGSLFAQYQGFADINMGRGAIVIGLAAVIIGEVLGESIFRKHMNFIIRMLFVIVGGILYYIAMGIVLWLKMPRLLSVPPAAPFSIPPSTSLCFRAVFRRGEDRFSRSARQRGWDSP